MVKRWQRNRFLGALRSFFLTFGMANPISRVRARVKNFNIQVDCQVEQVARFCGRGIMY